MADLLYHGSASLCQLLQISTFPEICLNGCPLSTRRQQEQDNITAHSARLNTGRQSHRVAVRTKPATSMVNIRWASLLVDALSHNIEGDAIPLTASEMILWMSLRHPLIAAPVEGEPFVWTRTPRACLVHAQWSPLVMYGLLLYLVMVGAIPYKMNFFISFCWNECCWGSKVVLKFYYWCVLLTQVVRYNPGWSYSLHWGLFSKYMDNWCSGNLH